LSLSLEQAKTAALQRNWDLLASAAGIDAALAQRIAASEFPNPVFSLSTQKINVDNHGNGTVQGNGVLDRSYDTIAAINQLFEIGGKRGTRRASAKAGFESAKASYRDAIRTLHLGVTKAYVAAALAEENARILNQTSLSLRQETSLAQVRLAAGEISTADKSQIEISATRFELDARTAKSAAAQARVTLDVLLGNPHPTDNFTLTDNLEMLAGSAEPENVNHAIENRADIIAAEAALRKAEADLRLQKLNRIPDPTLLVQYEHEPPDMPNSIGLGISLPLPLWNRNRGNISAAEAARRQASIALDKLRAEAASEFAIARLSYDDALQRLKDQRDIISPKSEHVRKTVAYAYERGGSSLLDLLIAERNDNEVRLATAQAASDLAIARATLKAATTSEAPGLISKQ
jgi:cobalt-zinc-cadmium efflux system outer membrane protein